MSLKIQEASSMMALKRIIINKKRARRNKGECNRNCAKYTKIVVLSTPEAQEMISKRADPPKNVSSELQKVDFQIKCGYDTNSVTKSVNP